MVSNYFLYTEDDEKRNQLIFDARQMGSVNAVKKLLNENGIYLDDYTNPAQISLSLRRIDFKTLYKRRGTVGSVGIGGHLYEVITDS